MIGRHIDSHSVELRGRQAAARRTPVDRRWVFHAQLEAGWDWAHEP